MMCTMNQMNNCKFIIWGYPLYSHTLSYINNGFYKALKFLGHEVYWFSDDNYPVDFNWNNCIFWTEGFADLKIPLNSTSIYYVHGCSNPKKYLDAGVKRFFDVRYNNLYLKDHIYDYNLDKSKVEKLGPVCYYQAKSNNSIRYKNDYHDYLCEDYDKIYISWATNKLPIEFDENDLDFPRENKIYYCGSIGHHGLFENYSVIGSFIQECQKLGIQFVHNDPWHSPLTDEEVELRHKQSLLGVDIRGPEHLKNGYIPCRIFKMISVGHLGLTNSKEIYNELEEHCTYAPEAKNLLYVGNLDKYDTKKVKDGFNYVKENHTYLNRIQSLLKVL